MNTNHHTPHQTVHAALRVSEQLKPFSEEKDPMIAAVCGFFVGGIGLGLYFKSWADFAMPVFLWVMCAIFAPVTVGTSYIAAGLFCAAYGYRRAKASNEKLRSRRQGAIIDVEPSPVLRGQSTLAVIESTNERLARLTVLREQRLISDSDFEAKKREILGSL